MRNTDLRDFLIRLKDNVEHVKHYGDLGSPQSEAALDEVNSQAIKDMQNTIGRFRNNLSITESRNASFFFDIEDFKF